MNCALDDEDPADDDDDSVHSAFSCESGGGEDHEEAEYLALELLHHLPEDKAHRLIRGLRDKENMIQDLQRRNRQLMDSYHKLNEAMSKPGAPVAAVTDTAAAKPAAGAAGGSSETATAANAGKVADSQVDKSIWQRMQVNKDEEIRRLRQENQALAFQVRRLDDYNQQLMSSLKDAQKDLKKILRRVGGGGAWSFFGRGGDEADDADPMADLLPEEAAAAQREAAARKQEAAATSAAGAEPAPQAKALSKKARKKKKAAEKNGAAVDGKEAEAAGEAKTTAAAPGPQRDDPGASPSPATTAAASDPAAPHPANLEQASAPAAAATETSGATAEPGAPQGQIEDPGPATGGYPPAAPAQEQDVEAHVAKPAIKPSRARRKVYD